MGVTVSNVPEGINAFFEKWVGGWNARDAHALAKLHTDDAVTINRYGTLIEGRAESEKALGFLLGPTGPFGNVVFPPMVIRKLRDIAPNVAVTQVDWSAPALGSDGKVIAGEWNHMVLTYCLVKSGKNWLMTQVDGHNVDRMELPYSQPEQKK